MRSILFSTLALGLIACAAPPERPLSPELMAHYNEPLVCDTTQECSRLWRKAQAWIVNNSGYKIQTATDSVVQTFNAQNYSSGFAMQMTRVPKGAGEAERIDLDVSCGSTGLCAERADHVLARFRRDMRAAQ